MVFGSILMSVLACYEVLTSRVGPTCLCSICNSLLSYRCLLLGLLPSRLTTRVKLFPMTFMRVVEHMPPIHSKRLTKQRLLCSSSRAAMCSSLRKLKPLWVLYRSLAAVYAPLPSLSQDISRSPVASLSGSQLIDIANSCFGH